MIKDHKIDCRFRRSAEGPIGFACEHGYDLCPVCDSCNCGSSAQEFNVKPAEPSFGATLRGFRLGWRFSPQHGAFIRMTDSNDGRNYIELAPITGIPSKSAIPGMKIHHHRAWWDDPPILELLPWLRPISKVLKYIAVECNDEGRIIRAFTGVPQ